MYSVLIWMLRMSCSIVPVDSENLHKVPRAHKVISPESFGH